MKKLFCLLLFQASLLVSFACINEYHIDKYNRQHSRHEKTPVFYNSPDIAGATRFLSKYDPQQIEQYDKEIQSDIAVNLLYVGKKEEALSILRRLQKKYPGEYTITTNLGTAYELNGKNDSALFFIKKGIDLNNDSHEGSEWVHVKILEAKIHMAGHPGWLYTHRVLNTGASFSSPFSEILSSKTGDIEYQLQERVPFTPYPDAIMGNVFDELGDLYATQQSIELAYMAYDFSLLYDSSDRYTVRDKMKVLQPLLAEHHIPLPSWRDNYLSRTGKKITASAIDIAEKQLNDKNIREGQAAIGNLWDNLSGARQRRKQKEERRRAWLMVAGLVLVSGITITGLYRRQRKAAA